MIITVKSGAPGAEQKETPLNDQTISRTRGSTTTAFLSPLLNGLTRNKEQRPLDTRTQPFLEQCSVSNAEPSPCTVTLGTRTLKVCVLLLAGSKT